MLFCFILFDSYEAPPIAKKIGCAHTNLYNYFGSLDELFWEALAQVLLKMLNYCSVRLDTDLKQDEIKLLFFNLIDFSLNHPGWYRLIWMEPLKGTPSPEIAGVLRLPGKILNGEIIKASNNVLSPKKAAQVADILHRYIHSELCIWINNRSFIDSKEAIRIKLFANLKYLCKLLKTEAL